MLNIVSVYQPSINYDIEYVNNLYAAVKRNLTVPFKFSCLTSSHHDKFNNEINVVQLQNKWSGWYGKIEQFKPGLFTGQVVFIDLDIFIIKNIDFLSEPHFHLIGCADFYHPRNFNSSIMSWQQCQMTDKLYDDFVKVPEFNHTYGDQGYMEDKFKQYGYVPGYLQNIYPGKIVSYKADLLPNISERKLKDVSIVACHGQPKPRDIYNPELRTHWIIQAT